MLQFFAVRRKARGRSVYQAPRGTQDILPEDIPYYAHVERTARRFAVLYGYQEIRTPTFEDSGVFRKGTGEATDIVAKEMYSFYDKGGSDITLRPEGTPPIVRAYLQHGLHARPQPIRLFSLISVFRYDRPQAGRWREFQQFDCEAIGEDDPHLDAELITLLWQVCEAVGLKELSLQINSIGDPVCRPNYVGQLRAHYRGREQNLCGDCRRRLTTNPLRLLDCKAPTCQPVADSAPAFTDHLCDACRAHFAQVTSALGREGIGFSVNRRLVRGLDYYTRTVFELCPPGAGQQSSVAGGGRYDGLAEQLGGRHTPGVGFAAGIERLVLNLKSQGVEVPAPDQPVAYVAHVGDSAEYAATDFARALRAQGVATIRSAGQRSLRARLRHADSAGVRWTAIFGEQELGGGTVSLRDMAAPEPESLPVEQALSRILASAAGRTR